jgi:alkanesulfonate monooxygenase SsuD/methylene tetrahydromethanopterin reductase-like flavin-dependent oxidoreductase (luciferase family)
MQQSFVALRTGQPGKMKPPIRGYLDTLPPQARMMLDGVLSCSAIGGPAKVREGLSRFIDRTGVDEIVMVSSIYDHDARKRSLTIAAEAMADRSA